MKSTEETVKPTEVRGKIGSMSELTITEFLEARITEDEAAANAAVEVWPHKWRAQTAKAHGWRNRRLGVEPDLPFLVSDDEHGSLIMASIWPEDGIALPTHIARHDPARVLAECAAKRAIIEAHPIVDDVYEVSTRVKYGYACSTCFSYGDIVEDHGYCDTLRALAAVCSSHPDYDTGWAL